MRSPGLKFPSTLSSALFLPLLLLGNPAGAQETTSFNLSGRNLLESSWNPSDEERTFEQWTDLRATHGMIAVELGLTAFPAPNPINLDTTGTSLSRRSIEFATDNSLIRAGHFDATFGNGLVLASFRDRQLRWNNDLDGFLAQSHWDWGVARLISAEPRDKEGGRHAMVQGGDLELSPLSWNRTGGSFLISKEAGDETWWGGVRSSFFLPFGSFAGEFAARDFHRELRRTGSVLSDFEKAFPEGRALYLKADAGFGDFTWMGEYKDYRDFELRLGAPLNAVPTVAKEHDFTLPGRKQLEPDANDEVGFTTQLAWLHPLDGSLKVDWTRAWNHDGRERYHEVFGSFDLFLGEWSAISGGGVQRDMAGDFYINAVGQVTAPEYGSFVFKLQGEHQWGERKFDDESFYTQAFALSAIYDGRLTVTPGLEWMNSWDANEYWPSVQVDWTISSNHTTSCFVGKRQEGKVCSGGVCVYKPPFEGVEWTLTSSF